MIRGPPFGSPVRVVRGQSFDMPGSEIRVLQGEVLHIAVLSVAIFFCGNLFALFTQFQF